MTIHAHVCADNVRFIGITNKTCPNHARCCRIIYREPMLTSFLQISSNKRMYALRYGNIQRIFAHKRPVTLNDLHHKALAYFSLINGGILVQT